MVVHRMLLPLAGLALSSLASIPSAHAAKPAPPQPDAEAPPAAEPEERPWKLRVGVAAETNERQRKDVPWLRRWAPERLTAEIGVFGGLLFIAPEHDFYDPAVGFQPLAIANPEIGLRAAFFPERYIGVEAEFAYSPTAAAVDDGLGGELVEPASIWAARGHVVLQLPFWSVTPFIVAGGGAMGIMSDEFAVGSDVDPVGHWGGGLKIFLHRYVALRVEGRHVISAQRARARATSSHGEFLLGLSVTLNRAKPPPAPKSDRDGDGFIDKRDRCPDTPGLGPHGCPDLDRDDDGILDETDSCPDEPETMNNYKDTDGCPDEIPPDILQFSGVIENIEFETDSTELLEVSTQTLDAAIEIFTTYPEIRIEIIGHTDNEGEPAYNMELSKGRAEAVKEYLVLGGIDGSRLETRGAGETEPIATNDTPEGRAKNRRTEFRLLGVERRPRR